MNVGYKQAILPDSTKSIHLDSLLDALTDLRNNKNQEHKADIVSLKEDQGIDANTVNTVTGNLERNHRKDIMYAIYKKRTVGVSGYTIYCKEVSLASINKY